MCICYIKSALSTPSMQYHWLFSITFTGLLPSINRDAWREAAPSESHGRGPSVLPVGFLAVLFATWLCILNAYKEPPGTLHDCGMPDLLLSWSLVLMFYSLILFCSLSESWVAQGTTHFFGLQNPPSKILFGNRGWEQTWVKLLCFLIEVLVDFVYISYFEFGSVWFIE